MRSIIVAAIVLPLVAMSSAQAKTQFGPGATTCETFLRDVQGDKAANKAYHDWIAGFLSGINEYLPGPDFMEQGKDDSYFQAVEAECQAAPSQDLSNAVIELIAKLEKKLAE